MQADFDKFKRMVQDIVANKVHEKDISVNTPALKKDINNSISALKNINDQIDIVTNQDVLEIETIIERINSTIKVEDSKAKEQMLLSVLKHTDAE